MCKMKKFINTGEKWLQKSSGMIVERVTTLNERTGSPSFDCFVMIEAGNGCTWMSSKGVGYVFGCTQLTLSKLNDNRFNSWEKVIC